jgi:metabolite-proton symporter
VSATTPRSSKVWSVVRVAAGNCLEMYDFMIFGYYAGAIGAAFFPSGSRGMSLMLSLATFGAGFLMRPLGAIVLGAYTDRHGRRKGLLVTLGLMSLGTLTLACVPGYRTIGIVAPLVVVAGRLVQGFSAGAELGGVSVYLAEIATPGNRGFYVSWQSASQQVAVIFAAVLGVGLNEALSREQMDEWGWRIPLLVGCLIVPVLFVIRRSLEETDEFRARRHRPRTADIFRSTVARWRTVVVGVMLVTMTTVLFYLITAYTSTFSEEFLNLDRAEYLPVTLCVGLSNFFWLPVMGALSDRIGRRPLLVASASLALLTGYPAMAWLVSAPSFSRLLVVQLWLSFLFASYNGAMVVQLTEIIPVEVRALGFSLAYSLATALFGGFTPAICTWLIARTEDPAIPGAWLAAAAACGLTAALLSGRRTHSLPQENDLARAQPEHRTVAPPADR